MFAYYFPPCTCWPTASTRAEGLANGLAANGWSPIVVTRANGCPCLDGRAVDDGDRESVRPLTRASEIRRIHVRTTSIARLRDRIDRWAAPPFWRSLRSAARKSLTMLLVLADGHNDWVGAASAEGDRLLRERHVDAVWTTAPPYRAVHIGRRLQRRHRTPWVADLRDSIARSYADGDTAPTGRRLARPVRSLPRRRWMRDLRHASAVVCVSPQEARIDAAALRRRVRSLPSGFDPATWHDLRQRSQRRSPRRPTASESSTRATSCLACRTRIPSFPVSGCSFSSERVRPAISLVVRRPKRDARSGCRRSSGVSARSVEDLGVVPVTDARTHDVPGGSPPPAVSFERRLGSAGGEALRIPRRRPAHPGDTRDRPIRGGNPSGNGRGRRGLDARRSGAGD